MITLISFGHGSLIENCGKKIVVFLPEIVFGQRNHLVDDWIIFRSLFQVEISFSKHGLESVLETLWVSRLLRSIFLVISNSENGLQELGVVQAIHDVKSISKWWFDVVDFSHALTGSRCVISRSGNIHKFDKVHETLESDEVVFILPELLLLKLGIELEVVHQLLMINRQNGH